MHTEYTADQDQMLASADDAVCDVVKKALDDLKSEKSDRTITNA